MKSFRRWFLLVMLVLICPLFFVGGPDVYSSALFNNLWNYGHVIFFATALLFAQLVRPIPFGRAWVWVVLAIFVLGLVIEFVQNFVGRDASWSDVTHNVLGAFIALCWGQRATDRRYLVIVLRVLSVVFMLPMLWVSTQLVYVDWQMRKQFPLINSFETSYELHQLANIGEHVSKQQVGNYITNGQFALAVTLAMDTYSGIKWVGRFGDWSQYRFFALDIYNPSSEALQVVLKIADLQHDRGTNALDDRFNRRISLNPGWNNLRIAMDDIRNAPAKRQMRIEEVNCLELFAVSLPKPQLIYVDNLRLE